MIDIFNIVDGSQNRQVFYANGINSFYSWIKPQNCQFVHFFLIGGGGGGGGGQGAGTATARRGGGSGGSSAGMNALVPASYLPEILHIQVGGGGSAGIGGTTNSNGGAGTLSYVLVASDTGKTASNVLYQSGTAAAGGGASGLNGGTAGTAGTLWSETTGIFSEFSLVPAFDGLPGVLGQTTPIPNSITISGITTPGAAGAGMNGGTAQAGGNVNAGGNIPTMTGGPAGGSATNTTPGGSGSGGYMSFNPNTNGYSTEPLVFLGGAGGGSSDGGPGGQGGHGAFGSGGGGGGAGITNQGGNGGRGGDGLVIITYW
jgi:hypothetical protein